MRKTNLKKLAAVVLSAAMVLSMGGMTAFAEETNNGQVNGNTPTSNGIIVNAKNEDGTYVNNNEYAHLYKYLVMKDTANVPNATFSFSIAAGDAVDAKVVEGVHYPAVKAGVQVDHIKISDTVFEPTDSTSTNPTGVVTLEEGEKFATEEATIDFTNVAYTEPGIYRYVITEKKGNASGITYDENTSLYLDVYVVSDNNGVLSIADYILHKSVEVASSNSNYTGTEKTTGFVNKYATEDITLKKTVTGNQGNRSQYFEFEVIIKEAVAGTVYTVVLPETDCDTRNKEKLTAGADGTLTATYYLKHDQQIVIQGLTPATNYTIEEKIDASEGYTTTYKVGTGEEVSGAKTTEQSMSDEITDSVEFINDRKVTTPTGIALTFAPYALLVALAGVFGFFFLRKKREDEV